MTSLVKLGQAGESMICRQLTGRTIERLQASISRLLELVDADLDTMARASGFSTSSGKLGHCPRRGVAPMAPSMGTT
jgi:hypothetical protein